MQDVPSLMWFWKKKWKSLKKWQSLAMVFAKKKDLLSPEEVREAVNRLGFSGLDYGANTDWQDKIYRTAFTQRHDLSVSGGSTDSRYRLSVNYLNQDGIIQKSDFEQFNGREFEFYWEGHRRHDQIRLGKFTAGWGHKEPSEDFRKVFPIPQTALDVNPNLVQNEGY